MFGNLKKEDSSRVNGYVVYNFHTDEMIYEVERKYWDKSDELTFIELSKSNINCQFVPLHVWKEPSSKIARMARFAILED